MDFMLDNTNDLLIKNGDLVVGETTTQESRLIVLSSVGNWRQFPLLGVGVIRWVNKAVTASVERSLQKAVRLQMEYDDKKLKELELIVDENNRLLNLNFEVDA